MEILCVECNIPMESVYEGYVCMECGRCQYFLIVPERNYNMVPLYNYRANKVYKKRYHIPQVLKRYGLTLNINELRDIYFVFNMFQATYNGLKYKFGRKNMPHYSYILNKLFEYCDLNYILELDLSDKKIEAYNVIWNTVIKSDNYLRDNQNHNRL